MRKESKHISGPEYRACANWLELNVEAINRKTQAQIAEMLHEAGAISRILTQAQIARIIDECHIEYERANAKQDQINEIAEIRSEIKNIYTDLTRLDGKIDQVIMTLMRNNQ